MKVEVPALREWVLPALISACACKLSAAQAESSIFVYRQLESEVELRSAFLHGGPAL